MAGDALKNRRDIYLAADTPFMKVPRVVVYRDTWDRKLAVRCPGGSAALVATLQRPGFVCIGTSNPGYVAFVSGRALSASSGSPFVVFVDPRSDPAAVVSVGYRREFRDLREHVVLWQPG